jgi:DNA-binding FrmR family transcriptional regulator
MPTTTNPGYINQKDKILKRLTRAEGQIRGISRMVAEDTYCIDVLTQISAAQAALDKTALELLRDHARHCLTTGDQAQNDKKADELVKAIDRLMAR